MKVTILLPTLNEERSIKDMIVSIKAVMCTSPYQTEIVVVDSYSVDKTVSIAYEYGARVLFAYPGKANAVRTAFEFIDSDYLILVDADNTYPVKDIPKMLRLLETYDIVIGSRMAGGIKDEMKAMHKVGNLAYLPLFLFLHNVLITDMCSGFYGFNKCYKNINISADGFELEANLRAESLKFNWLEFPCEYYKRTGESKISVIDGFKIFIFLIRNRMKF